MFLVLIDDAGFCDQINNAGKLITKKKIKEMNVIHLKYVDDLSLAESVDMTSLMLFNPCTRRDIMPKMMIEGTRLNLKSSKTPVPV